MPSDSNFEFMAIVSLGFLVVVLAGTVVVLRRNMQRLQDIRARRLKLGVMPPPAPRRPSDDFHDAVWLPLCEKVEAAARNNGYLLVKWERQRVWRSKSTLVLETLIRELEATVSEEDTARAIGELPPGMDRPDPTAWCEKVEVGEAG